MRPMFVLEKLRMGRVVVETKLQEEGEDENAETTGRMDDLLLPVSKEPKKPTSDIEFKHFMNEIINICLYYR
jgi:hypothetical protein